MKARILLVGALLFTLTCEVLASSQRHVVVNRTADSGPGTLREALTIAVSGDLIVFNPDVFPPTSPVTIPLTSALPVINQGNLAIDASNAGVILDGSGIGTTPETMLLDDVSLTLDGGPNLIINGDFTAGLGHWRPWDEAPGATRSITTTDFKSPPNAYEWTTVVHAGDSRTVYDTTDTSEPFDDWPYYDGSTVWIPATGNAVEVRFWYRSGVGVRLWAVFPDGVGLFAGDQNFPWEADWTEGVFSRELPPDAVGVALELYYRHPQGWTCGLPIESNGNTVQGLQIVNFPNHGIALRDAQSNTIGGNREVGIGPLGQGNLVSGNGGCGVELWGESTFNTISGNYIGTDVSGTVAWGNRQDGVAVTSHNRVIDNLISGNGDDGVGIGGTDNTVSGNFIGTDANGLAAIPNSRSGVDIGDGNGNLVGGDTPEERNIISGNNQNGVWLSGPDTISNTISGNYIGTDVSGTVALGNGTLPGVGGWGVVISDGALNNTIGGTTAGERNIISGNGDLYDGPPGVARANGGGIDINADGNTVSGNYIGTDVTGTAALPNAEIGVSVGGSDNLIGGDTPEERNVISGNSCAGPPPPRAGVLLHGTSNTVSGNYIGTDVTGTAALPNEWWNVWITGSENVVGAGNLISGNVAVHGNDNTVTGNFIGTDASGTTALRNEDVGISLKFGASGNLIGGNTPEERNLVSGNGTGVSIEGSGTDANTVSGNYIGTNISGTAAISNTGNGVYIGGGASYNLIGGSNATPGGACSGECNLISGNGEGGVRIEGSGTMSNTVSGNYIGTDASGGAPLPNEDKGVYIRDGAQNNTIGGSTTSEGNVIAYNGSDGVLVDGSGSTGNTISHNSITANGGSGIENQNGGNTELAPPVITETAGMTVSGTACTGCALEFFSDDKDEGRVFEGSTTAEGDGTFTFNRTESFTGPNVTATATDADGNTSEFSAPVSVPVLTIEPDVGTYGTRFDITGSGWVPGEIVTVESFWPDGSPIGSWDYTADANGDIDPYNWVASPGEPAGIYTWTATGPTSGSVTKTFEVLPAAEPLLVVWPDSGVVGETFYIGGSGFQPSENTTLTLTGPATVTLDLTADEGGNFFTEWDSTGQPWGIYTVNAVGDQGSTASDTFEVLPAARIYLPLVTFS